MPWLKNGWPIWSYTPEEWVKLRVPAMNDTKEQKKYLCDLYDHLAKFRLIPTHTYPDGRIQFSCPCCAGRLKVMNGTDENGDLVLDGSENDEAMAAYEAMRAKAKPDAIEVYLPEGVTKCCRQPTVVLHPEEIPDFQDMFPFSTGWTIDMNNRNLVENVNGRLKAQNSQANSNYAFVLGLVKLTIVYTFLLMGHNILIQLKQEEEAMLEAERQRREMAAAAAAARAAQNPPRRNHWGSRARARSRASPVP